MKKTTYFILFFLFLFLALVKVNPVNAIAGLKSISLSPTNDSQIDYENENQNFGRWPYFSTRAYFITSGFGIGLHVETDNYINALIKFNLSSIPQGSYIQNAYLKLYVYNVNADAPCELYLSRINGDWDERWITAKNAPQTTIMNQYHLTVRGTGYIINNNFVAAWQISDLVKKWFSGEYKNHGIMIENRSGKEDSLCKFYSKDETVSSNQGKKPQLIVDYLPPLTVSLALAPENQITSTSANIYWTSSIPVISVIYYKKGTTGNWVPKMNNNLLTNDRIILSGLTPNTRYYYKVYVRDDINRDKTTAESSFITKNSSTAADPNSFRSLLPSLGVLRTLIGGTPTPTPTPTPIQNEPDPADVSEQNQNNDIKIMNFQYGMTNTGGTFRWTTKEEDGSAIMADVKTNGFVYLSKNAEPTKTIHDFDFGKNQAEINHIVTLKYLEPNTTYNYLVFSEDDNNQNGSIRGIITTTGSTATDENSDSGNTNNQSTTGDQTTADSDENNQAAFPWGNDQENASQTGSVSGSQNPLRVLLNKLTGTSSNNQTKKPNLFLIILVTLIVVLIILIMSKKKKTVTTETVTDVQKPPVKAAKHIEKKEEVKPVVETAPKKKRNWFKIIIFIIIGFFLLSFLFSTLTFFSPMAPFMLLEAIKDKFSQSLNIKNLTAKVSYKEAETANSFAKINQSGGTNLSFSAVSQTEWPTGTIGGLYKIEPSGNFSKLADMTIDLKDNVTKGFALGYYHPDTKKWEYIPTIRIFGNTYKALIAHASEVGGYAFGLSGALDYEPHFQNAAERAEWESLKIDLARIASDQSLGRDTSVAETMAEAKLDRIAYGILNRCATSKTFDNQMDYFYIWHIAQLIHATKVDEKMGTNMKRCVDLQATREESRYDYMIREHQDLKNDLNIPEIMQFAWKGTIAHEGYPLVSGLGNTDWHTNWQVIARTEYHANVQYGALLNSFDLPTPEGTWGNGIVTHILLFSLKNIREGQTFKIRGVSVGDAPGYYRNWHEDFKWQINHPSTVEQPIPSDPNKHVFDMTGTLVQDNGKEGAIIKYGGLSKEQQTQMDAALAMIKNSGMSQFKDIPAYFQEMTSEMKLNIIKGNPYNE